MENADGKASIDNRADKTTLNLADIVSESVVDGLGIRMTLFVQGCAHRCEGCHNPQTWEFVDKHVLSLEEIKEEFLKNPLLDGMTFSGGEPFSQAAPLAELARWLHKNSFNVWCYTGYTLDELTKIAQEDESTASLLNQIDVLVDGRFIESQKNLMLKFRGSANQRILDLNKTRATSYKTTVLLECIKDQIQ